MYSLEEALEYWKRAGNYGSVEERIERGKLWMPYYSFLAKKNHGKPYHGCEQAKRLTSFLLREGLLQPEDTVLDIGAGMGNRTLEIAGHCKEITALDSNGDCLKVLQERAKQCGVQNIKMCNTSWEEYRSESKFSMTFSAMCPAICDREEILRLESMTERTACLFTVMRGSYEKHRRELMQRLPHKKPRGMVTEALHYYNVLYLMGRCPGIKTWSDKFESSAPAEELIERYAVYFEIFGVSQKESRPVLESYFAQCAQNGIVTDVSCMNTALIYWNVPESLA